MLLTFIASSGRLANRLVSLATALNSLRHVLESGYQVICVWGFRPFHQVGSACHRQKILVLRCFCIGLLWLLICVSVGSHRILRKPDRVLLYFSTTVFVFLLCVLKELLYASLFLEPALSVDLIVPQLIALHLES